MSNFIRIFFSLLIINFCSDLKRYKINQAKNSLKKMISRVIKSIKDFIFLYLKLFLNSFSKGQVIPHVYLSSSFIFVSRREIKEDPSKTWEYYNLQIKKMFYNQNIMKIFCLISVSKSILFFIQCEPAIYLSFIFQENKITLSLYIYNQSCLKSSHIVYSQSLDDDDAFSRLSN